LLSLLFFFEDDFSVRLKKRATHTKFGRNRAANATLVLMSSIKQQKTKNKSIRRKTSHKTPLLTQQEQKMFTTLAASSSTVVVAGRISSSSSTSSSSKTSTSIPSLGGGLISKNNFVSFQTSSSTQKQQKRGTRENVVIRATENEEDEYMFKPTANAGGKGGVLDRDNPLLEEKFAVIGDGEHE
jgi:hypothetical protein